MTQTLKQHLKKLGLSGMLNSLEERLQEAEAKHPAYAQFLELLLQDELNRRRRGRPQIGREHGINRKIVGQCSRLAEKPKASTSTVDGMSKNEVPTEVTKAKIEGSLNAQRVFRDLIEERRFTGSYRSSKRPVRRSQATWSERICRLQSQPGERKQLDFVLEALIDHAQGKRRIWSVGGAPSDSQIVRQEDTQTFLHSLENGR
jgi:hypothetical protein